MDNVAKNKLIAKNTLALYFRLILATGVALYTSRVVLQVLGITDYGVYNVVGGIVVLLSFLQTALTNSIQRYLNYYANGHETDGVEQRIYSSSFHTIGLLALVAFIFCETVGLWIVNCILNIPPDRMTDANIVYQISIATMIITLLRAPFEALIIAHERMHFFALASIIESVLKLATVLLLFVVSGPKLILYALLVMSVSAILDVTYYVYSRRYIPHVRPNFCRHDKTVKAILKFSGWNAVSGAAQVGYQQGANIILNIFFGVTLNATMGIANQVKMAAFLLATNITVAANPQITKSYANGDLDYMRSLVCNISKYAYFLIFTVGTFLILNIDFILGIWLVEVPPECAIFCILVIVFCMVDCQLGPLWTVAMAEGNIRNYQIITGVIMLLNLPLIYIFLYLGGAAWWVVGVQVIINVAMLVYRLWYLVKLKLLDIREYLIRVSLRILLVTVCMTPVAIAVYKCSTGLTRGIISCGIMVIVMPVVIYLLGLRRSEQMRVNSLLKRLFKREALA